MFKMDQVQIKYALLCRICQTDCFDDYITLDSETSNTGKMLVDIFNELLQLDISARIDDELPQQLCHNCFADLLLLQKLVRHAKESDMQFRQDLIKSKRSQDAEEEQEEQECAWSEYNSQQSDHEEHTESDGCNELFDTIEEEMTWLVEERFGDEEENQEEESLGLLHCDEDGIWWQMEPYADAEEQKVAETKAAQTNECKLCNKLFSTEDQLRYHADKELKCLLCDIRFCSARRLEKHISNHSTDGKYSCEVCQKLFLRKADMTVHMRIHQAKRPNVCEVCGKGFNQRSVLKTHMTLHTGKPISCSVCKRKFSRPSFLRIHMRVHTGERPYKCTEPGCSQSYMQKSHLDRHTCSHRNITFSCDQCDKRYRDKSVLAKHIREHHSVRPQLKCSACDAVFVTVKGRRNHIKTKHPEEEAINVDE